MIIYKTCWFNRWARKQGLDNASLCAAVHEMITGLFDADLGGELLKKTNCTTWRRKTWWLSHISRHE